MLKTRLTLAPGANGTKKLVERYGRRLVCVRYRYDEERRTRVKTVELIEEESPWAPSGALYLVKIPYDDLQLRTAVKSAGARWNRDRKAWLVPPATVRALRLEDRIIGWLEPD
jgi:hypothetical protein